MVGGRGCPDLLNCGGWGGVNPFREVAHGIGERHTQRALVATLVAAGLVAVSTMLTMGYDGTAAAVIPVVLVLACVMLRWPWLLFAFTLAQFSILPIEGYLLGFYVPNLTQFLVPALLFSMLATAAAGRNWGTFRLRSGDVFVVAFVLTAVLGIVLEPGPREFKYFVNQVLFAVCMYFAARWLRLDRHRLRILLGIVLGAAAFMLGDLALVQLTGVGGLWKNERGPLGALSDQATYSAIFPALFLYMAVTTRGPSAKRLRALWLVATLVGVVAAAGGKERSGVAAALAAVAVCGLHPKMMKYVAIGAVALIPIGALWLSTDIGSEVHSRFADDEDPMLRRRIYVGKAIDYIKSDQWHPLWGTGFARLGKLSNSMLSETEVVWDPNTLRWRHVNEIGLRPIHCAPVTIFGEYGYAGTVCLAGVGACAIASLINVVFRARRRRAELDTALMTALGGAALSILINALFHNTDVVFEVTSYIWAGLGLIVGHADVLFIRPVRSGEGARASVAEALGRGSG